MGSNANRHGDKKITSEWGSKARKEAYNEKHRSFDREVIDGELDPKPTPGGKRRKKDTKRWCRGKEGREHTPELVRTLHYSWLSSRSYSQYRCSGCGRKSWS